MPLSPSATRALLAALGHRPRRSLGQNFLVDGNIVRKSLELAAVRPGDAVVEIGPGLGTLTLALLEAGAEVWAVESDPALHRHLAASAPAEAAARLHLSLGDAVERPLAGLPPARAEAGFKIVANLPYAISTPWLDGVLAGPLPERLVLMLQQEAARRYTAAPGSKAYGAVSIFLQAAFRVAPGHRVSAACFHPRPEVESVLLRLERKRDPAGIAPAARELIRACFRQRRKQIGPLLRGRVAPEAGWWEELRAAGLSPRSRPEEIPVELWLRLASELVPR